MGEALKTMTGPTSRSEPRSGHGARIRWIRSDKLGTRRHLKHLSRYRRWRPSGHQTHRKTSRRSANRCFGTTTPGCPWPSCARPNDCQLSPSPASDVRRHGIHSDRPFAKMAPFPKAEGSCNRSRGYAHQSDAFLHHLLGPGRSSEQPAQRASRSASGNTTRNRQRHSILPATAATTNAGYSEGYGEFPEVVRLPTGVGRLESPTNEENADNGIGKYPDDYGNAKNSHHHPGRRESNVRLARSIRLETQLASDDRKKCWQTNAMAAKPPQGAPALFCANAAPDCLLAQTDGR